MKKRILSIAVAAAMMVSFAPQAIVMADDPSAESIVKLDPSDASPFNNGEFEGWGTSLCWWANRLGYSEKLTEQAAEAFFSENGLGLDIARYNLGGGDDPTHDHITRSDSKVPGYATGFDEEGNIVYDWTVDENQRNIALAALKANPDLYFEGFSNSPPWFMTNSGCSSGAADAGDDNLSSEHFDDFGKFIADVTKHFKDEFGITFQSYSPMNEPDTTYWGAMSPKQEGAHYSPGATQSGTIIATRKALDNAGLDDVIVAGMDETDIGKTITNYAKLTDEAKTALGRIDTHTYSGSNRAGVKTTALGAGKNLWMSEVDGNWNGAGLAQRIIDDLNGMKASAWVMWDIVDFHKDSEFTDPKGNKTEASASLNPTGSMWGVGMADHDNEKLELAQKYYAYGQFTKYIKPGMTLVGSSDSTLAAYDKKTGEIVIVALNSSGSSKVTEFDLRDFAETGEKARVIRSTITTTAEKWARLDDIAVEGKEFTATLNPNTVTTFVVPFNSDEPEVTPDVTPEIAPNVTPGTTPAATLAPELADKPYITEFEAGENGLSYKYIVPQYAFAESAQLAETDEEERRIRFAGNDGSSYNTLFAIYNADGTLKLLTVNEPEKTIEGDFTGCTPKLMVWRIPDLTGGADGMTAVDKAVTEVSKPIQTEAPQPTTEPETTAEPTQTEEPKPTNKPFNTNYMTITGPTRIEKGTEYEYAAYINSSADKAEVTWSVSDEAIASVTADGKLKAVKGGLLSVIATAADGQYTGLTIRVTDPSDKYIGTEYTYVCNIASATNNFDELDLKGFSLTGDARLGTSDDGEAVLMPQGVLNSKANVNNSGTATLTLDEPITCGDNEIINLSFDMFAANSSGDSIFTLSSSDGKELAKIDVNNYGAAYTVSINGKEVESGGNGTVYFKGNMGNNSNSSISQGGHVEIYFVPSNGYLSMTIKNKLLTNEPVTYVGAVGTGKNISKIYFEGTYNSWNRRMLVDNLMTNIITSSNGIPEAPEIVEEEPEEEIEYYTISNVAAATDDFNGSTTLFTLADSASLTTDASGEKVLGVQAKFNNLKDAGEKGSAVLAIDGAVTCEEGQLIRTEFDYYCSNSGGTAGFTIFDNADKELVKLVMSNWADYTVNIGDTEAKSVGGANKYLRNNVNDKTGDQLISNGAHVTAIFNPATGNIILTLKNNSSGAEITYKGKTDTGFSVGKITFDANFTTWSKPVYADNLKTDIVGARKVS